MPILLEVEGLGVDVLSGPGWVPAVQGVGFQLDAGQALGLVGESGSGKSLTALALLGLLPRSARASAGEVRLRGRDLRHLAEGERRRTRGAEMALILQDPAAALNPVVRVGEQIAESLRLHRGLSHAEARAAAVEAFGSLGVDDPGHRVDAFPHELSGGLRQRVLVAIALAGNPALVVADEPTTAVDVTLQAQILALLGERRRQGMALLLVSHDLSVVSQHCDSVAVMYAGEVVELGPSRTLRDRPAHPYTAALWACVPSLSPRPTGHPARLRALPGTVPSPGGWPAGCRFRNRCERAVAACREPPPLKAAGDGHQVACHHPNADA